MQLHIWLLHTVKMNHFLKVNELNLKFILEKDQKAAIENY